MSIIEPLILSFSTPPTTQGVRPNELSEEIGPHGVLHMEDPYRPLDLKEEPPRWRGHRNNDDYVQPV